MERLLIRTKTIPFHSSTFNASTSEIKCECIEKYASKVGIERAIVEIFDENLDELIIIQKKFEEANKTKKDNDFFKFAYKYNATYCITIDQHITLYKIDKKIIFNTAKFSNWIYPSVEMYLADTWWYDDKEILDDIQHLNLIEFIDKYKGI